MSYLFLFIFSLNVRCHGNHPWQTPYKISGGARTSRQPGHIQVSTVVRQVISCELCEGPKVKISVSQGASQGRSFLARAFDLPRTSVAPPLYKILATTYNGGSKYTRRVPQTKEAT